MATFVAKDAFREFLDLAAKRITAEINAISTPGHGGPLTDAECFVSNSLANTGFAARRVESGPRVFTSFRSGIHPLDSGYD